MALTPEQATLINRIAGPQALIREIERTGAVVPFAGRPGGEVAEDPVTGNLTIVFSNDFSNGFTPSDPDPMTTGQDMLPPHLQNPVWTEEPPGLPVMASDPGQDLRDVPFAGTGGGVLASPLPGPGASPTILLSRLLVLVPAILRGNVSSFFRQFSRNSVIAWQQLPGWMRTALVAIGLGGATITIDQLFFDNGDNLPAVGDIGGHLMEQGIAAHIVGTWVANGVTFYRLSDGKLAVQNKLGRWKVWRPKKPIVLMPGGAGDLRTLLRADAVLNKQAKKIAAMLNRRTGGSRRKPAEKAPSTVALASDGSRVAQI